MLLLNLFHISDFNLLCLPLRKYFIDSIHLLFKQNRTSRIEVIPLDSLFDDTDFATSRSDISEFASASEFVSSDPIHLQVKCNVI